MQKYNLRHPLNPRLKRRREISPDVRLIIASDRSSFYAGQCRNGNRSGGGTIFNAEFGQDALDVLTDRPGACAQDNPDLIVRFALCDPNENLRFARGEIK